MDFSIHQTVLKKISTFRGFVYFPLFGLMAITYYNKTEDLFCIWPAGILIVLVGAFIRIWATKHIGRGMTWKNNKGKKLVRTGPYAIVRNPLYIGNIIAATGLSMLSGLLYMIPLVILYLFVMYHLVVLYEEKKLLKRWGEAFLIYLNEVPRWIPNLKNLNRATSGGFSWWDALRLEIPSLYLSLLAIFIFLMKGFLSHME